MGFIKSIGLPAAVVFGVIIFESGFGPGLAMAQNAAALAAWDREEGEDRSRASAARSPDIYNTNRSDRGKARLHCEISGKAKIVIGSYGVLPQSIVGEIRIKPSMAISYE